MTDSRVLEAFKGKTIALVDTECVNMWTFYFTDGTFIELEACCGSHITSIPYLEIVE